MESSLLTSKLVHLASQVAQQRFGVEATKEAYLLPEEILEDAWSIVRFVGSEKSEQAGISAEARAEIMKLAPLLEAEKKADLAARGWRVLMESPLWLQLRDQASSSLRTLGFNLGEWEAKLSDG